MIKKVISTWILLSCCFFIQTQSPQMQTAHNFGLPNFDEAMICNVNDAALYKKAYTDTENKKFFDFAIAQYHRSIVERTDYRNTPRIPKIIHQIWIGPKPFPKIFNKLHHTWIEQHPDWEYKLWTNQEVASLELINQEYFDNETNWGAKSDILRLEILYQYGGLYVDIDFKCLKPFDILHHCCDFYTGFFEATRLRGQARLNNALIASTPGHPILKTLIGQIKHNQHYKDILTRTGPDFLTQVLHKTLLSSPGINVLLPSNYLYPWTKNTLKIQDETFGIHYYAATWNEPVHRRTKGKNRKGDPRKGKILSEKRKKLLQKKRGREKKAAPKEKRPITELPLAVLICSHNNAEWVQKNLDSVFAQDYTNFRIIYLDDGSSDDTVALVQKYIKEHKVHDKITLIAYPERCRKMKRLYAGAHSCDDHEIIIQLDGDDWFCDSTFFSHINCLYQSEDVWLTYGTYKEYPSGKRGATKQLSPKIIQTHAYRKHWFVFMHPRTFYAWLFKSIKLQDAIVSTIPEYEGHFIPASNDLATMIPMAEMAHTHMRYLPEVTYTYNRSNPLLGNKVDNTLQKKGAVAVRLKTPYDILEYSMKNNLACYNEAFANVVILSHTKPENVKNLLRSLYLQTTGIKNIYVLYTPSHTTENSYKELKTLYPSVQFIPTRQQPVADTLHTLLQKSDQKHIIIAKDTTCVQKPLNVQECIVQLEQTFAHGFYFNFSHDQKLIPYQHIWNKIYAWKFNCGPRFLWNTVDMTLFRKKDILKQLELLENNTPTVHSFLNAWAKNNHIDDQMVGLFFEDAIFDE